MSDWNTTVLRRQAGLEPGFHGGDEPLDEFMERLERDDELVRGLGAPTDVAQTGPDTWTPPSYLPPPEPVAPQASATEHGAGLAAAPAPTPAVAKKATAKRTAKKATAKRTAKKAAPPRRRK